MQLSIACSWDRRLVDELAALQKATNVTFELFGGLKQSIVGSGHSAISVRGQCDSRKQVESLTTYAREQGIRFNYTINASCLGNWEFTRKGRKEIVEYLAWVDKIADAVTVTIPLLVEIVKDRFDLEVVVSTIAEVDCVRRAQFYEALGADRVILDIRVNRDFEVLRNIRESAKCSIEVMVNNGCLLHCPYQYYHYSSGSHASREHNVFYMDYCVQKCFHDRMTDTTEYMKIPWIRPEDLHWYEPMVDWFKIAGREMPTDWIVNCAKAYATRRYDGNFLDLMTMVLPSVNEFAELMLPPPPEIYIDNRRLEGFVDHWRDGFRCVSCGSCHYCSRYANELIEVDPLKLQVYREKFDTFLPLTLNIDLPENRMPYEMVRMAYNAALRGSFRGRFFTPLVQAIGRVAGRFLQR